ncbi:hypothetical protein UFOVP327_27 [uncultured Caudovirales phage]|jgi:hypothetical protein|uniref:Uncharacterized protein n=1 Tax=uncultured Caudovirales phage TaxID=2100421 RepID=A0A6J5M0F0_9CAUD|nr:hypothetical protein UFOVP327_27 [uncultured Caudovirales phage]
MQILDDKSDKELLQSVIAEVSKARAELRCAEEDIKKAAGRIGFLIVLANELINRQED